MLYIYIYIYIYIYNDLNEAISHSIIHHFPDDTIILLSHKSLKKINKYISHDLCELVQWLRGNKILEQVGKKMNIVKQTKYLGIYLDEHLTWSFQLDTQLSTFNSNKKQVK